MGLVKIIIIGVAISLIISLIRTLLGKRHLGRKLPRQHNNNDFIAEELYKLNELKNRGILTEEEYQRQKRKLIG